MDIPNKTFYFIALIVLCVLQVSNAQYVFSRVFDNLNYNQGSVVRQTSDGGFLIAGECYDLPKVLDDDFFLLRTNNQGDALWIKRYSGPGSNREHVVDAEITSDGGYILAIEVIGNQNKSTSSLAKFDSAGNIEWSELFLPGYPRDVEQTTDGGFIIANATMSLIKTDNQGLHQWNRRYDMGFPSGSFSVEETSNGGYILTGNSFGDGAVVLQTDANGNVNWSKTFGEYRYAQDVKQAADGNYIIAGTTQYDAFQNTNLFLLCLGTSGDVVWNRTFQGPSNFPSTSAMKISLTSNTILVSGENGPSYTPFIMNLSSMGDSIIWLEELYGHAVPFSPTTDGGVVLCMSEKSLGDILLTKLDSKGDYNCRGSHFQRNLTIQNSSDTGRYTSPLVVDTTFFVSNFALTLQPLDLTDSTLCKYLSKMESSFTNGEVPIYPNPTNAEYTVELPPHKYFDLKLVIYNSLGQEVDSAFIGSRQTLTLTKKRLSNGIYYLYFLSRDKVVYSSKIAFN